jgi:hypothetical protein
MCARRRRIAFSVTVGGTARAMSAANCSSSARGVHVCCHETGPTSVQRPPKRSTQATPSFPRYTFSWLPGASGRKCPGGPAAVLPSVKRKMALAMSEIYAFVST